jgi:uncharacterized protein (TIGR02147 family)
MKMTERPIITQYKNPVDFLRDMIAFQKKTERNYSVHKVTKNLRRVSPALISLIISGKRKITIDRVEELSTLLRLNAKEKFYFRAMIQHDDFVEDVEKPKTQVQPHRREVESHFLKDWLNIYVKDLFQIPAYQKRADMVISQLSLLANPKRVKRSLEFLLREGYLRRTLDGKIVPETRLAVADPQIPNEKIRQAQKAMLSVAKIALDFYPSSERFSNALTIPLDARAYQELTELIQEFAERLKDFAEKNDRPGERLYQLIVNLSPVGGSTK